MVRQSRPFWTWIHKWIALSIGLWIALNGLSGTILVFQREIEANLALELYRTGTAYETPNFEVMTNAVADAYPDKWITTVERDNKYPDEAYRFTLANNGEAKSYFSDIEVFVNPVDGEIIGDRSWLTFMKATRLFHMELLAGKTGKKITGYLCLLLALTVIVGVVLWWPKNKKYGRALRFKRDSAVPRMVRDLHNVFGMYFLVAFSAICVTGVMIVFPGPSAKVIELFVEAPETQPFSLSAPQDTTISLQDAADAVQRDYPGAVPTLIGLPSTPQSVYSFRIEPAELDPTLYTSVIYIDQYTGDIVSTFDPVTQPTARSLIGLWSIYTHNGQIVGMPGRLFMFGAGIAFAALFGTGVYIWLKKRRTTYAKPTRSARATLIDQVPAE